MSKKDFSKMSPRQLQSECNRLIRKFNENNNPVLYCKSSNFNELGWIKYLSFED